jgi:hypothetical protein
MEGCGVEVENTVVESTSSPSCYPHRCRVLCLEADEDTICTANMPFDTNYVYISPIHVCIYIYIWTAIYTYSSIR